MTTVAVVNPVTEALERAEVSMADLARTSGASYTSLSKAANGLVTGLSPGVRGALATLGVDSAQAAEQYAAWRESLRG